MKDVPKTASKEASKVMFFKPYLPLFLLIFMLYACDSNPGSPDNITTGVAGTVLRGPVCPVVQEGEECPDEPFAAQFDVFTHSELKVASFETAADGRFQIELPAGDYLIVPDETAPVIQPTSQQKSVTVLAGQVTSVTLVFDTGIR